MKFEEAQHLLQRVLKQRNFGYVMAAGLLGVNLILVFKLIQQEQRWILIPQFNTNHRVEVTTSGFSEHYLIDWADNITRHLLTVNAHNVDRNSEDILKITSVGHGPLKEKFQKDAQKIKQDNVSTVFYPKDFSIQKSTRTILVTGQFLTYFGQDKAPISLEKTYILEWRIGKYNCLFLHNFKEKDHE